MTAIDSFIGYYEETVPSELCDAVIDHYGSAAEGWKPSTYATHAELLPESEARVDMDVFWITENLPYQSELQECFREIVFKYQKRHPDFVIERITDFRLNRYAAPKAFMSRHVDNIHHSHGQEYGYPVASSLLFLNDDYEGGEFVLCDGLFNRKPAKGSGIIFPSNFMFPHEVKRVKRGVRYSIVAWLI